MITYVKPLGGNVEQDYAVMKLLAQLKRCPGAGRVEQLRAGVDLSRMTPGEVLYIAAHGMPMSGEISGALSTTIAGWLNDDRRGVPPHIGGVFVLACYSGADRPMIGSVVDRIARRLKHEHIPVKGAVGFAYGSPKTERGLASVLPTSLKGPYKGNPSTIFNQVKAMTAPRVMRIGGCVVQPGQRVGDVVPDARLREWARQFQQARDAIEARMQQIVHGLARGSVPNAVDALHRNKEFQDLVRAQHKLFEDFFLSDQQGYKTVIS